MPFSRPVQHENAPNLAGWFAVAVFLAAYAVSFLDRQILSLIVEPLKHDLGISDTQIGIVQGPAFGLFYATLLTMLGGACAMTPAAIVMALLHAAEPALLADIPLYFSIALTFGIATVAFVEVTPPPLRGQVVALYLLVGKLVGLALGPVSVGALLDSGIPSTASVGHALALVCAIAGLPSLWLLWRARTAFAIAAARAEE